MTERGKPFDAENEVLTTQRLTMKAITPAVIHHLNATRTKAEIMDFFGFGEKDYEVFESNSRGGMETARISLFFFLIIRNDENRPIGQCGFHTWDRKHRRAELFYLLYRDADKQLGFMKEALPAALDYGFTQLGLHRIEAMVASYNVPSVKLIQSNGFTFEGTKRQDYWVDGVPEDSDMYSLLASEWLQ